MVLPGASKAHESRTFIRRIGKLSFANFATAPAAAIGDSRQDNSGLKRERAAKYLLPIAARNDALAVEPQYRLISKRLPDLDPIPA